MNARQVDTAQRFLAQAMIEARVAIQPYGGTLQKTINHPNNIGLAPHLALAVALLRLAKGGAPEVLEPKVKLPRLSPYLHWVRKLLRGHKVRVCQPWNDGATVGGHVSVGEVTQVCREGIYVEYIGEKGRRHEDFFHHKTGASGPYAYLVPTTHDVVYDPDYGLRMKKRK